jgi:hypothetical protein
MAQTTIRCDCTGVACPKLGLGLLETTMAQDDVGMHADCERRLWPTTSSQHSQPEADPGGGPRADTGEAHE